MSTERHWQESLIPLLIIGIAIVSVSFTWWVAVPLFVIGVGILISRFIQREEPPAPDER